MKKPQKWLRPEKMWGYFAKDRRSFIATAPDPMCKRTDWENDWYTKIVLIPKDRWPLPNVWLGVSVESQDYLGRIDILKDVPAAVRFVSFEPLLEDLGALILDRIRWAIIGGESGPKARRFDLAWARSVVRQCNAQNVAPFVKQWGRNPVVDVQVGVDRWVSSAVGLENKNGSDILEWHEDFADLRVREFPKTAVLSLIP